MPLTVYCTDDNVRFVWSQFGIDVRADDGDDHDSDQVIADAISKATTDVNLYLMQRYTPAVIAASTWVRWCTAYFAAVALGRRRGNGVPQSLLDEYQRYLEALKGIQAGTLALPGDDGLAAPQFDNTPGVSNMRIDSRYRSNIRRVRDTSTPADPNPARPVRDLNSWPYPFPSV